MTDQSAETTEAETMRGRVDENRLKFWLLLKLDRWVLAGGLLVIVLVTLVVLNWIEPTSFRRALGQRDPVETFFQAMVTAIITGVTLVVSINQLVLSQELGAVGDQRRRMNDAIEFRTDAEEYIDESISPAKPSSFLQSLLVAISSYAERLHGESEDDELTAFADGVARNADEVTDRFESAQFGTFQLLNAALDFNYSGKIYRGRVLREKTEVSAAAKENLDSLLETLKLYGPAREHFKTLYFQWELINLSRAVLYTAVPALTTAIAMILFFDDPSNIPGTLLGIENVFWAVTLGTLITVSPFMLLVSYILRIATVAKRTLAIGPFILRDTDDGSS